MAASSIPKMIPFFLLLFACGYSIFRSDMVPYQAGKNLSAMVGLSSGVDVLAPPFCILRMEEGAPLEREAMSAASAFYVPWEPGRRDNGSASYARAAVGVTDLLVDDQLELFYGLCSLATLSCWIIAGLWWWCQRTRGEERDQELGRGVTTPRRYRYRDVAAATGNFAESRRIGRDGFGAVYRGFLSDSGGRHVAVKALSPESLEQGRREFEAEVRIIGRLRHRGLVQLQGWCDCRRGLFLVYELIPEGNLDQHLHSPHRLLNWSQRYTIALDLGSALLYLHTECEQCVVHGDIKPSNVMLDSSRRAKLGDFGMARLVDHGAEPQTTQVVAGTVGYIDPEFVNTGKPSTESDVYSFGVALLEVASGKRPTCTEPGRAPALLRRVRDMSGRNCILDAADHRLNGEFDREQMERVLVTGLWCAHRDRGQRPSISQAMAALRSAGDDAMHVLPELHGTGRVRGLEEQAYGDLSVSDEESPSTRSSAYHTPENSCHLHTEESAL